MKRNLLRLTFLFVFMFLTAVGASAKVYKYTAYEFAYQTFNERTGDWSRWSRWEKQSILVVLDIDKDRIQIYSNETQEFDVLDKRDYIDSDGADNQELDCVDADGVRCKVTLREQTNGVIQLYCEYADINYVYNIEEK